VPRRALRPPWDSTIRAVPTVLLIRHAQASFGAEDYDALSPLGRRQVDVLRQELERRGVVAERVLTGSLRRQRDSAAPWPQAIVDPAWNEYDDHDILSHHTETTARLDAAENFTSRDFQAVLDAGLGAWIGAGAGGPCAETWPRFCERIDGALARVTDGLGRGQTALVFSSSGVISALAARLVDADFLALNRIAVNTAITKVIVGSRGRTLVSYNEHGHLEEAGLLTYR
jgi:broad specificity phosphatase PhoE